MDQTPPETAEVSEAAEAPAAQTFDDIVKRAEAEIAEVTGVSSDRVKIRVEITSD